MSNAVFVETAHGVYKLHVVPESFLILDCEFQGTGDCKDPLYTLLGTLSMNCSLLQISANLLLKQY